ncbi:hypothetical protein K440DRAFT_641430 [Wilcoxina mikolae CBS 423.85]|nr:hypothetical protein K440DRAFT_641430 [Wilcoxina mikolae CBS 423.85]
MRSILLITIFAICFGFAHAVAVHEQSYFRLQVFSEDLGINGDFLDIKDGIAGFGRSGAPYFRGHINGTVPGSSFLLSNSGVAGYLFKVGEDNYPMRFSPVNRIPETDFKAFWSVTTKKDQLTCHGFNSWYGHKVVGGDGYEVRFHFNKPNQDGVGKIDIRVGV